MRLIVFFIILSQCIFFLSAQENKSPHSENPFITLISFYSNYISPLDGARSPSFPTGSAYGLEAFRTKGVILGMIITVDRLVHEIENRNMVHFKKNRVYDPLDSNIFWWDEAVMKKQHKKVCLLLKQKAVC